MRYDEPDIINELGTQNQDSTPPSEFTFHHGHVNKVINSAEDVAQAIFENLQYMIKNGIAKGAPGRKHMPQSDSGGEPIDRLGDLARGDINVSEPFGEGRIKLSKLIGK